MAKFRKRANSIQAKKSFTRTAIKTKKINIAPKVQRNGIIF